MVKQTTKIFFHLKIKIKQQNFHTSYEDFGLNEWGLEENKKDLEIKTAYLKAKKLEDDAANKKAEKRAKKRQIYKARIEKNKKNQIYEILVPSTFSKVFLLNKKLAHYGLKQIHSENYEELTELSENELDETGLEQIKSGDTILTKSKTCTRRSQIKRTLTIRIKPNNVFCTLKNETNNQIVSGSSTKYKIKMSKKTLRYNYKIVVRSFLEETKKMLKSNFILVNIIAPKRIRRELLRILKKKLQLKKKPLSKEPDSDSKRKLNIIIFSFYAKKCFNGCRAKKKRRNKQRGLRIYK